MRFSFHKFLSDIFDDTRALCPCSRHHRLKAPVTMAKCCVAY